MNTKYDFPETSRKMIRESVRMEMGWPRNLLNDVARMSMAAPVGEMPSDIEETLDACLETLNAREQQLVLALYVQSLSNADACEEINYTKTGLLDARQRVVFKMTRYKDVLSTGISKCHGKLLTVEGKKKHTLIDGIKNRRVHKTEGTLSWPQNLLFEALGEVIAPLPVDTEDTIRMILPENEYLVVKDLFLHKLTFRDTATRQMLSFECARGTRDRAYNKLVKYQQLLKIGRATFLKGIKDRGELCERLIDLLGTDSIDALALRPDTLAKLHASNIHTIADISQHTTLTEIMFIGKSRAAEIRRAMRTYGLMIE